MSLRYTGSQYQDRLLIRDRTRVLADTNQGGLEPLVRVLDQFTARRIGWTCNPEQTVDLQLWIDGIHPGMTDGEYEPFHRCAVVLSERHPSGRIDATVIQANLIDQGVWAGFEFGYGLKRSWFAPLLPPATLARKVHVTPEALVNSPTIHQPAAHWKAAPVLRQALMNPAEWIGPDETRTLADFNGLELVDILDHAAIGVPSLRHARLLKKAGISITEAEEMVPTMTKQDWDGVEALIALTADPLAPKNNDLMAAA